MAVHEFKESLSIDRLTVGQSGNEGPQVAMLNKRINLQEGKRHTLMAVDFMDDSLEGLYEDTVFAYEVFVSPYPINLTAMNFANLMQNRGPAAGSDQVLWKKVVVFEAGASALVDQQMPNNFLGSMPTSTWYTPTLYLTVVFHTPNNIVNTLVNPCYSFYLSVQSEEVDTVEYFMGCMGEMMEAYTRSRMSNGVVVLNTRNGDDVTDYQGYTFPMWKYGGIRPEYMLRGRPSFMNFFNQTDGPENMIQQDQIVLFIGRARNMVAFDEAFGEVDVAKGPIPDWIRFVGDVGGLEYGNVRPNFPPMLKFDDGVTQMV